MKEVNEMPTEGQFVAVYTYNGKIWSGTYLWDDEGLAKEYCIYEDGFVRVGGMGDHGSLPWVFNEGIDAKFFVEV